MSVRVIKMEKMIKMMFFLVLFLFPIVFSENPQIEILRTGYGATPQKVCVIYKNIGDVPLTNYEIYIDGEKIKTIQTKSGPGMQIEGTLTLEPGEHFRIERLGFKPEDNSQASPRNPSEYLYLRELFCRVVRAGGPQEHLDKREKPGLQRNDKRDIKMLFLHHP